MRGFGRAISDASVRRGLARKRTAGVRVGGCGEGFYNPHGAIACQTSRAPWSNNPYQQCGGSRAVLRSLATFLGRSTADTVLMCSAALLIQS